MSKRRNVRKLVCFCAVLILVLGLIVGGLRILESTVLYGGQGEESPAVSKTITRDGVDYFPRQDITVMMMLGIDEDSAANLVTLLILDSRDESYSLLCLNPNMMAQMDNDAFYGQLALSHTYGEEQKDRCENTRNAVSNLLYGITIDHYMAMDLDTFSAVNDAVGGVAVHVTEDFSGVDSSIPQGDVTLSGEQALVYTRNWMDAESQLAASVTSRQMEYMERFMEALTVKLAEDKTFAVELYNQAADGLLMDCSLGELGRLLGQCADYTAKGIVTPEGETVQGEAYLEFYADEKKLDELILRLFYAPR